MIDRAATRRRGDNVSAVSGRGDLVRTRSGARRAFVAGAALLAAAATLGAACGTSVASGAPRAATVSVIVPDAAVNGCDVLLDRARRAPLPAAVAERRVHGRARTRRPVGGSTSPSTVDPTNVAGRARRHHRGEHGRRLLAGLADHDLRPGPEHRAVEDRDVDRTSASRSRRTRRSSSSTRRRTRGCRTSPSSTRRRRTRPSSSC